MLAKILQYPLRLDSQRLNTKMFPYQIVAVQGQPVCEFFIIKQPDYRLRKIFRLVCNQDMLAVNYGYTFCSQRRRHERSLAGPGLQYLETRARLEFQRDKCNIYMAQIRQHRR